jgi:hypothetical protein
MAELQAMLATMRLEAEAREADAAASAERAGAGAADEGGEGIALDDEGAWDDSALVDAYDAAVRRYQQAHGLPSAGACGCARAVRGCARVW